MASNDLMAIVQPFQHSQGPGDAAVAARDVVVGGSALTEEHEVAVFDDTDAKYIDFPLVLPPTYDGGGLTLTFIWVSAAATAGETRWSAAFRAFPDDAEAYSSSHSYDFNAVDATPGSAADEIVYDDRAFTDGADMDNLAAGEFFILRVRREAGHANDDMTGDAYLLAVAIKET